MLQYYFSCRQIQLIKCSFFIHSTPYMHPRLDSRIEPKYFDLDCFGVIQICIENSVSKQ